MNEVEKVMDISELNKIIEREHQHPVPVSQLVYPEVEELYLNSPKLISKSDIGTFYQDYDYVGIRNALEIMNNYQEFKSEVMDHNLEGIPMHISPSQEAYLKLIGWATDRFNFNLDYPWVSTATI